MFSKRDIHTVAKILSIEPVVTNGLIAVSRIDPRSYDIIVPILEKVIDILISNPENAYKKLELPKKSWGIRTIYAPLWDAVMEEKKENDWENYSLIILWLVTLPKQICAFRYWIDPYTTLRSTLDWINWWQSTEPPKQIWGMFKIDISDFFNSITEEQVKNAWSNILSNIQMKDDAVNNRYIGFNKLFWVKIEPMTIIISDALKYSLISTIWVKVFE
jgi:hypothetical protein